MVNAVAFTSADGFKQTFPLQWLLERGAILANRVGGEPLTQSYGGTNQLWIAGAAARLFVRDVVAVDFLELDDPQPPSFEADEMLFQNRPNASVGLQEAQGSSSPRVGESLVFEGYAYDFDRAIVGVEFSLDRGFTWTRYDTLGTDADRWVWWEFSWEPKVPGAYELRVRSVNELGVASPTAAVFEFDVEA